MPKEREGGIENLCMSRESTGVVKRGGEADRICVLRLKIGSECVRVCVTL